MAITRAQQAKQMLQKGGRIGLKKGSDDKKAAATREARRTSQYSSAKRSTASTGRADPFSVGFDAREAQKSKQYSGITPTDDSGRIIPVKDKPPPPKPEKTEFQKFKRRFNPFPFATSVLNKISNSKLARINNALQRQNYIDSLDLTNPEEKEEYDRIMNQLGGLGMDIIAGPKDLEDTRLTVPPSMLATDPMTQFKTVDGVSALGNPGVDDVLGQGYQDYLNRFNVEDTGRDDTPMDPCLGPNPPAYCPPRDSEDPEDETPKRNLAGLTPRIGGGIFDFTEFAADGGRIGLRGGKDASKDDYKTPSTTASAPPSLGFGNPPPSTSGGGDDRDGPKGPPRVINPPPKEKSPFKKKLPTGVENAFRTVGELNYLRNLFRMDPVGLGLSFVGNKIGDFFFTPAGAAEMTAEEKEQLLKDAGVAGATTPPAETFPRFLADEYETYKDIMGGPAATESIVDEYKGTFPGLLDVPTQELEQRFEKGIADPNLMQVSLPGQSTFMAAKGGIAGIDREEFLLGGIAKGLKKAVRGVKKLAKSPIGKAAILGAIGFGIPGVQSGFFSKGLMGTQKGLGFKKFLTDSLFGKVTDLGIFGPSRAARTGGILEFLKSPMGLIAGSSVLAGLATPKQDGFDIDSYYADGRLNPNAPLNTRIAGSEFDFYGGQLAADGGRIGYQEGSKEPVAKKTMPLLDMEGMEKDYRETGGFVPIGRMEKADDVPARLSKNEFVFTADAVRNAGDGDIDKGSEVMYNMMKNLEAGGEVSEESQGLEGARNMFQTSQRLGEVI